MLQYKIVQLNGQKWESVSTLFNSTPEAEEEFIPLLSKLAEENKIDENEARLYLQIHVHRE